MQDSYGVTQLRYGDCEYRTASDFPDPFPLYPGERLQGRPEPLQVLKKDEALLLEAIRDSGDRKTGDRWLFKGPATYSTVPLHLWGPVC